jgi:hypothetical protein
MENIEMINLWKQYDEKLEKTISINHKLIAELQQQKAKSALRPARNYKVITILIGLVYAALISYFWYHLHPIANVFVNVSIAIHLIVILLAIAMYAHQIVLINQIDCAENIMEMQYKMAKLKSSTLKVIGICFLQFPIFATWNINLELITKNPFAFWLIQVPIVVLFTYIGIWFYKNINIKNIEKRWFRMMFWGTEWQSILKAGKFLKEIENFEKN